MAWARIDDAFDDHPKVLALLDMEDGAAAIGLWTLCLTYAHRNTRRKGKTPGHLPTTLPRRFLGAEGRGLADLLVKVGLWDEVSDGWMIHDFAEYLPGKEVSAARSAAGKKGAAARWGNKGPDGNLPSPGGKPDGNAMAADGTGMATAADSSSAAAVSSAGDTTDGNQPSADSNLPSESHPSDDNPVASDGSRARARRGRVDVRTTELFPVPGPGPVPPSAGTAEPRRAEAPAAELNAGDVVGAWIEAASKHAGERPANRTIAQVGRQARELLAEGKDPARLIEIATSAGSKGYADLGIELLRAGSGVRELRPTGTGGHQPYRNPTDQSVYHEDL